jgi:hypothetical protein
MCVQYWPQTGIVGPDRDRNFVLSTENLTSRLALSAGNLEQGAGAASEQFLVLLKLKVL